MQQWLQWLMCLSMGQSDILSEVLNWIMYCAWPLFTQQIFLYLWQSQETTGYTFLSLLSAVFSDFSRERFIYIEMRYFIPGARLTKKVDINCFGACSLCSPPFDTCQIFREGVPRGKQYFQHILRSGSCLSRMQGCWLSVIFVCLIFWSQ